MNKSIEKSQAELLAEKYLLKSDEREQARLELIAVMKSNNVNKILLENGIWITLSVRHDPDVINIKLPIKQETSA